MIYPKQRGSDSIVSHVKKIFLYEKKFDPRIIIYTVGNQMQKNIKLIKDTI